MRAASGCYMLLRGYFIAEAIHAVILYRRKGKENRAFIRETFKGSVASHKVQEPEYLSIPLSVFRMRSLLSLKKIGSALLLVLSQAGSKIPLHPPPPQSVIICHDFHPIYCFPKAWKSQWEAKAPFCLWFNFKEKVSPNITPCTNPKL